jgi:hypothetical protein
VRADMFKVIVERPRMGGGYARDGRKYRDDPDGPHRIGMKRGYRMSKWLNENLAPLKRYLLKQAGRHWNDVHSELCRHIDRRNAVLAHIFAHIDHYVAQVTQVGADGIEVLDRWYPTQWKPLREARAPLFVHPETGLLVFNDERGRELQRLRLAKEAQDRERASGQRRIDENTMLERIDGVWYRVTYAPLPQNVIRVAGKTRSSVYYEPRWDVKKRKWVALPSDWFMRRRCELTPMFAKDKRQIGKREIRRLGLRSGAKPCCG